MATSRNTYVNEAKKYVGAVQGSQKHHKIIDIFNSNMPDGYHMSYHEPWCATFVSAMATALGANYEAIIPRSASCSMIINKAKKMGCWVESDWYQPKIGDLILYDWEDDGKGDNKGAPNHIGIVAELRGNKFSVLEGNMSSPGRVGYRTVDIDGRYIRGFVTPKYDEVKPNHVRYRSRYGARKHLGLWQKDGSVSGKNAFFIRSIICECDKGQLWVRGRTKKEKKWTDWTSERVWLPNHIYDRLQFKLLGAPEYKVKYRVYVRKHGWLPWVTGYNNKNDDGYAGLNGFGIRKIEVKID